MNKRNFTLGLIVFLFGVFMVACGSKNNTSNTTNNDVKELPTNFDDESCEDCTRTFDGRFYIASGAEDLYLQAFGHRSGSDIVFGTGTIFEQVLGEMAIAILEPTTGLVVCGTRTFLTKSIAKLFGINNVDIECTIDEMNIFDDVGGGFDDNDQLSSSYTARLRVRYEGGRAEAVELSINSDIDGNGSDVEIFYYDRSNIYINQENTLAITNSNGRIRFGTANGQIIGEFRN